MTTSLDRQRALEAAHPVLIALETQVIKVGESGKVTRPAVEALADLLLDWERRGWVAGLREAAESAYHTVTLCSRTPEGWLAPPYEASCVLVSDLTKRADALEDDGSQRTGSPAGMTLRP